MKYRRLSTHRQDIDAESCIVKKSMWAILSTEREEILSTEKSKENKTYFKRTTKLIRYLQYTSKFVRLWITLLHNLELTIDK